MIPTTLSYVIKISIQTLGGYGCLFPFIMVVYVRQCILLSFQLYNKGILTQPLRISKPRIAYVMEKIAKVFTEKSIYGIPKIY